MMQTGLSLKINEGLHYRKYESSLDDYELGSEAMRICMSIEKERVMVVSGCLKWETELALYRAALCLASVLRVN